MSYVPGKVPSALLAAGPLTAADLIEVSQGGVVKTVTLAVLKTLVKSGATTPAPTFIESPSNTAITTVGPTFTTSTGLVFSLITGADNTLHVAVGGVDNGITHDVTTLLYYLGNVYHKNATQWYQRNADGSWTLRAAGDPRGP